MWTGRISGEEQVVVVKIPCRQHPLYCPFLAVIGGRVGTNANANKAIRDVDTRHQRYSIFFEGEVQKEIFTL